MNITTRIQSIRDWSGLNETHPNWQKIQDELALIEALHRQLHKHATSSEGRFNELPPLVQKEALLMGEVSFIRKRGRVPESTDELKIWMFESSDKLFKELKAKEKQMKELLEEVLHIKEPIVDLDYHHIDDNGHCGHDRELVLKMEPSFELISEYIYG